MPEGTPAGGQAAEGTQGEGAQGTNTQDHEEPFDKDRALNTIRSQREAERALKAQLAELQGRLSEHEQAKLSETEKLQKRLADLEAEKSSLQTAHQEMVLRSSVDAAARAAGSLRPEAVWRLVDLADIKFDASGQPSNVVEVITKVRTEFPELFGAQGGSADGGARGSTAPSKIDMNAWLRGKSPLGA